MDMLAKLYDLPALEPLIERQRAQGVTIRRPLVTEKSTVVRWVESQFGLATSAWVSECEVAFSRLPITCFLAVNDSELRGFACYDCICRGFFGPIGVSQSYRGRRIGEALLLACLHAMRHDGYGYAIIGHAGAPEFFQRLVNATAIPGSDPGIYAGAVT